jgi:hypothetical protein
MSQSKKGVLKTHVGSSKSRTSNGTPLRNEWQSSDTVEALSLQGSGLQDQA